MSISDTRQAQKFASIAEVAAAETKLLLAEAEKAPEYANEARLYAQAASASATSAQQQAEIASSAASESVGAAQTAADNATTIIDQQLADQQVQFQNFLSSYGLQFIGDYEDGPFTFTARNQYIRYDETYWQVAAATNLPFTTTGTNETSWSNDLPSLTPISDDDALRSSLAEDAGASLIGTSSGENLQKEIDGIKEASAKNSDDIASNLSKINVIYATITPEIYPHLNGVDTTGASDAGVGLTTLWQKCIDEGFGGITCRESDAFLLTTPVKIPYGNARYNKSLFDRWFKGNGARFYPGTNNMKMFMVSRPQVHFHNMRIVNSTSSLVPDPLIKNATGVDAFYFGSLYDQDSMSASQYEYMGFMYCSLTEIAVSGVNTAITLRPGASPLDSSGNYMSTGAYYCTFTKVMATECWYFCRQLESITPDNTSNRHRFNQCQHQGGLCSFFAEPRAGGDCKIENFLAETINWTPRTTGSYTDPAAVTACSVVWGLYDPNKTNGYGMMNSTFTNCNFEGNSVSVPNYFMPIDGCLGVKPENLMTPYRGAMLGKGTDVNLYPTIKGDSEDTDQSFETSLILRNAKSGIATGTNSNAAFNSRLRFRMYDGLCQFQLSSYQNKTNSLAGGSSTVGISVFDHTTAAQWTGWFGMPNKVRLDNTDSTGGSSIAFSTSLRLCHRTSLTGGMLYTPSDSGEHTIVFGTGNNNLRVTAGGILPGKTGVSIGYLGSANQYAGIYTTSYTISTAGLIPVANNTYDAGSTAYHNKDTYGQNSFIVVSDGHFKMDVNSLSDMETACAKECAKLYRRYKLIEAVEEKGSDNARYHVGAIAQDVMACFTKYGLDWRSYGIFVEGVNTQKVTKTDGKYIPIIEDDSVSKIATDSEGYISIIEGADALSTDESGAITITRTKYMLRYDEFNCFVNSGMCSWLEDIESRIS